MLPAPPLIFTGDQKVHQSRLKRCGFKTEQCMYTVFQKSDAKIQITITTAYLIRIKYPLGGFNYHFFRREHCKFP